MTAELAGEHNHATVQLVGELTSAMAELSGRVQPHDGSARRRADRRDVVNEEELQERDFDVKSSMSFSSSHWCRPTPRDEHRSMEWDEQ
ncbi:hypothetical protein F2Q68_00034969 [Brassica cretica]|uniref:Uncharacterized protein n=1 Tax=Brassica cretica TaxID=69181 RepID=A0A8S9H8Q6_BRACR|nr:hypothetical protein F2Q68_00034969 [Brassica cretica]